MRQNNNQTPNSKEWAYAKRILALEKEVNLIKREILILKKIVKGKSYE